MRRWICISYASAKAFLLAPSKAFVISAVNTPLQIPIKEQNPAILDESLAINPISKGPLQAILPIFCRRLYQTLPLNG